MSDLERELEQELHRVLDPLAAMPVPDRRPAASRKATRALLGGAGAALTVKLLTGVAVAAAAVTVAGASATGSLNPADWGRQVGAKLEDGLREGPGFIAFARENGSVFHTYTVMAPDPFVAPYHSLLLHRTPKPEADEPRAWRKDEYPD